MGIGDWAQSPIPNPQSPIPNPHYYIHYLYKYKYIYKLSLINNYNLKKINNERSSTNKDKE